MKLTKGTSAVAVCLFFGTLMPMYAQREGQGDKQGDKRDERQEGKQARPDRAQGGQDKGSQQQQRAPQAEQPQRQQGQQPQRAQQQQQPPQQVRQQTQPQRTQQEARSWQQQRGWLQQGGWQGHDTWQQNRAQRWSSDHRTWAQRGGYGGYYIPQRTFGLYFGRQHYFRLRTRPVMYLGYPRFEYSGLSFLLVDPWPEYWSDNWYDTSDVYIDYDDGYYLYNPSYPQVRLAITIAL